MFILLYVHITYIVEISAQDSPPTPEVTAPWPVLIVLYRYSPSIRADNSIIQLLSASLQFLSVLVRVIDSPRLFCDYFEEGFHSWITVIIIIGVHLVERPFWIPYLHPFTLASRFLIFFIKFLSYGLTSGWTIWGCVV